MKWKKESILCYRVGANFKNSNWNGPRKLFFSKRGAMEFLLIFNRGFKKYFGQSQISSAPCSRYFMAGPLVLKIGRILFISHSLQTRKLYSIVPKVPFKFFNSKEINIYIWEIYTHRDLSPMPAEWWPVLAESKGLFIWGKTPHLPDPGLRGEIPPSHRILSIFILRLHDERNTTGIVKSHLTWSGISPGWGEIFPYKRNTTGMVRWSEIIRWFLLVSSFWFHGRKTLLHLASQPRCWQVR